MQYLVAVSKMTEWSLCFQGKLFSNIVIQVCDPTSNAEEAEVEGFYENLQDLLELTPQKNVLSLWNEEKLLNCVWLFVTPRTVDYHAPPSMGFSRQEYWSGLPFPPWFTSNEGFPGGSADKESACNAGDLGSIPGLGRSPGEGKVSWQARIFQYPGLENSMDCMYSPWGRKELDTT